MGNKLRKLKETATAGLSNSKEDTETKRRPDEDAGENAAADAACTTQDGPAAAAGGGGGDVKAEETEVMAYFLANSI